VRIALIADTFTPLRTSGAVQLRDLAREFVRQGHFLCVLLPAAEQAVPWVLETIDGAEVLRLRAPKTKDINFISRTLGELAMPFAMMRHFWTSPFKNERWDAVVWYSPSIFHGPLVRVLKKNSGCKSYLIVRDIFPEWAVDMGLMRRGLPYLFFHVIARYQYSVADVIGVQADGNRRYFDYWVTRPFRKLEVLQNWLGEPKPIPCSIRVDESPLRGRKIFVYAGNMGVAQAVDIMLDLAVHLRTRLDIGFLFVGRGSELGRLKRIAQSRQLDNVVFFDEIDPDEIPDLYAQCNVGIVALDSRHRSHNIPGKFLTYMQSGLPVLASINEGNDLIEIIKNEGVGQVCTTYQIDDLVQLAEQLLKQIRSDPNLSYRCKSLFKREFSVENAVSQIMTAISGKRT